MRPISAMQTPRVVPQLQNRQQRDGVVLKFNAEMLRRNTECLNALHDLLNKNGIGNGIVEHEGQAYLTIPQIKPHSEGLDRDAFSLSQNSEHTRKESILKGLLRERNISKYATIDRLAQRIKTLLESTHETKNIASLISFKQGRIIINEGSTEKHFV